MLITLNQNTQPSSILWHDQKQIKASAASTPVQHTDGSFAATVTARPTQSSLATANAAVRARLRNSRKAYRDELNEELEAIPKKPRQRRIVVSDSRNTTGELGVSRTTKIGPNGTKHECYSVSWRPEPGVQKCTSFSIKKYGEKKSFKMAVEHRRKMMREIHGPNFYKKLSKQKKAREANG